MKESISNTSNDINKAIEYFKKHLRSAIENGDRDREQGAYGTLGNTYQSLGDYQKPLSFTKNI